MAGVMIGTSASHRVPVSHAKTFPAPIHEGSLALWHLAPVLEWLSVRAGYAIERHSIEIARIAMQINVAKESHRLGAAAVEDRIRALVT
jgi:hypothetical protein